MSSPTEPSSPFQVSPDLLSGVGWYGTRAVLNSAHRLRPGAAGDEPGQRRQRPRWPASNTASARPASRLI
jgi:hypothetical protein